MAPPSRSVAPEPLELRARPLEVLRSETSLGVLVPVALNAAIAVTAYVVAATGGSGRLWFFGSLFLLGALMLGIAVAPDALTLRADAEGLGLVRRTRPGGRRYGWVLPWGQIHGFRASGRWVELLVTDEPTDDHHPEDPPRWERLTGGRYGRSAAALAEALDEHRLAVRAARADGPT